MITIGGKNIADISISNKNVIKVQDAETLKTMWVKTSPVIDYFYIENIYSGSNTLYLTTKSNSPTGNHATSLQYSKDKTNWTTITLSGTNTIPMSQGEKVYFRNDNEYFNWYSSSSNRFVTSFACSEDFNVGGNINSLLNYTNNNVSLSPYCFYKLFVDSNTFKLINASNLMLPSTTLARHCYQQMFSGCSNLTTAPALPATTLASDCYNSMYQGCTSLTTAPSLPATTLAAYCYSGMFYDCTSLTTAPSLPATELASYCYWSMFQGCSSLTTAPSLPATILASRCYYMMFNGCTSLTSTPELPATTLAQYCYYSMFQGCTSLNKVTTYANDISASSCLYNWLDKVAPTGTFNNCGTATYTIDSPSGIPVGWTEVKPIDYFYIENTYNGSNTITLTTTKRNNPSFNDYSASVQYSKDRENWTTLTFSSSTPKTISMSNGEKVYFRNDNGKFNCTDGYNWYYTTFTATNSHIVGGNIVSLLKYTDMETFTLTKQGCLERLFQGDESLTDSYKLKFPNTTSSWCYSSMFYNCRNMRTSPLTLPATTLSDWCYSLMFQNCNNLTTTPNINATTLASNCYYGMFTRCTSLTTAPELPITTLADSCYNGMFDGCSSLTSAPSLPATTLVQGCYQGMFYDCTSLKEVTTYANDISAEFCLTDWLKNVSSSGTFHNLGSATYPRSSSGIPSGWTVVNN